MLIRVVARAAAVTVAVGLLGASCAGGPDAAAPAPTPPASASATAAPTDPAPPATPPPTPAPTATATASPTADAQADLEAAVLEAHAGYLEAYFESGRRADPDYPPLLERATGAALRVAQASRQRYLDAGWRVEGGYDSSATFVGVRDDGAAVVDDCLLDAAPAVDSAGDVVAPVADHRIYVMTVLVQMSGKWRVSEVLTSGERCVL
jgi:pyruvate/2-oxoglutarate dehydrogenase complex dihydrolipoamide acyltransferase (E2) component